MTTAKTEAKVDLIDLKSKISEDIATGAAALVAAASFDTATGSGSFPVSAYEASLKADGLDSETGTKYKDHDARYALKVGAATAELATPAFVANAELTRASMFAATLGKDGVTATFDRNRVVPDKNHADGKRTVHGTLSIDLSFNATKSGADLGHVKRFYAANLTSLLSD